jgi:hypothetical protein
MAWRYSTDAKGYGWGFVRSEKWIVGWVDPQGPAAGKLQAGDVILAFNDDPSILRLFGASFVWSVLARPDDYSLEVQRDGEQHRFALQIKTRHDSYFLGSILSSIAASFGFCLVGLLLGLVKPEDRLTPMPPPTMSARNSGN